MDLIIKNKIIEAPIPDIIEAIRQETGNKYFNLIGKTGKANLQVQCCYHKNGQENRMSASFFTDRDDPEVEYGFYKCFTCGKKLPLYSVVSHCLEIDTEEAKDWLVDNFGNYIPMGVQLLPIDIDANKFKSQDKTIIDESILNDFNYIHPYMYKRKLTDEVIAKYKIGFDPQTESITFPCWDLWGNLVAINRRNVKQKKFELSSNVNKEVYLLNFALNEHAKTLYICESQINALTLQTWGYQGVALLGTGCKRQYDLIKTSEVKNFILCLDPDEAGRKGTERFIKRFDSSSIIMVKDLPEGKDVNDLTQSEFDNAPLLTPDEWENKYL